MAPLLAWLCHHCTLETMLHIRVGGLKKRGHWMVGFRYIASVAASEAVCSGLKAYILNNGHRYKIIANGLSGR